MDLDELLGINDSDPVQQLADELVQEDDRLLSELVELRRKTMTQQEVADRLGISRPAVAAFERYNADPRLSTVRRYALAVRAHVGHTVTPEDQRRESVYDRILPRVRRDRSADWVGFTTTLVDHLASRDYLKTVVLDVAYLDAKDASMPSIRSHNAFRNLLKK